MTAARLHHLGSGIRIPTPVSGNNQKTVLQENHWGFLDELKLCCTAFSRDSYFYHITYNFIDFNSNASESSSFQIKGNIFSLSSYTWLPMIILIILWFHCIRQRNDQVQMHHNFDKSQKCSLLCFQYPTRWYFMAAAVTVYHDSQVFNPIITKRVRIQQI